jgi:3-phosphoshikimate 1-carboxyvinyltransferase
MASALRSLGAVVDSSGDDWTVSPGGPRAPATIDCGLSGTIMRFVPPVSALADGPVIFDGDPRARSRPMGPALAALRTLGVTVEDEGRTTLPFTVIGSGRMRGGPVIVDASGSSQFVSGLLLAGARYDEGVDVRHRGAPIPSAPHVEMTVAMLREHGVEVDDTQADRWRVGPGPIQAVDSTIEPDLSNAAPYVAAALVTGGEVTVLGWPRSTTQAGDYLREVVVAMGGSEDLHDGGLTVTGTGAIEGIDIDLHDVSELTPAIAALCALAKSPSRLRGVAHIRGHESDRLQALATELNGLGGDVTETDDGLVIAPASLRGGVFGTYGDHRMAHAGVIVALAVEGVLVEDIETTAKTYPEFAADWSRLF